MTSVDDGQQGIRVQVRMVTTTDSEQRFDMDGKELLQLRGRIIDSGKKHPEVVVRFGGQRRAELYRWGKSGKHLSVDGYLEIKTWITAAGKPRVALLIEALNISPLGEVGRDPSKAGVYSPPGRMGAVSGGATTLSKVDRAAMARRLLEMDDG